MSYDLLRLSLCSSICSYQIIKKRYRCVCLYNDTFMPFGIEHLRRAIVSCSTSPPHSTTTHKQVLYCEYAPWLTAPFYGVCRPGGAYVLSPLTVSRFQEGDAVTFRANGLLDRRTTWFGVRATTPHTTQEAIQGFHRVRFPAC